MLLKSKKYIGHIAHLNTQSKYTNTSAQWLYHNIKRKNPYFLFENWNDPLFSKTWTPFPQGRFMPNLVVTSSVFLYEKVLKLRIFAISSLSPPWKRAWSFIWTNFTSLHQRIDAHANCRTVVLRTFFCWLTDQIATVPIIVKNVYLLLTKSCTWLGLNFSIFLLCQVKIPDEKNNRHVYPLGKI